MHKSVWLLQFVHTNETINWLLWKRRRHSDHWIPFQLHSLHKLLWSSSSNFVVMFFFHSNHQIWNTKLPVRAETKFLQSARQTESSWMCRGSTERAKAVKQQPPMAAPTTMMLLFRCIAGDCCVFAAHTSNGKSLWLDLQCAWALTDAGSFRLGALVFFGAVWISEGGPPPGKIKDTNIHNTRTHRLIM